jgi:hypothetical protein
MEFSPAQYNYFFTQWNPVKKILKIPRKFLSRKFLKRVIFLTEFLLSEFHCISSVKFFLPLQAWTGP